MNENEILNVILNEIKGIRTNIDVIKTEQQSMMADISSIKAEQQSIRSDIMEIYRTKAIRRTAARVDRKIDHLGDDLADVLTGLTDAADAALKQAK